MNSKPAAQCYACGKCYGSLKSFVFCIQYSATLGLDLRQFCHAILSRNFVTQFSCDGSFFHHKSSYLVNFTPVGHTTLLLQSFHFFDWSRVWEVVDHFAADYHLTIAITRPSAILNGTTSLPGYSLSPGKLF